MKRIVCALGLLAGSGSAYSEGAKGFSHISTGQVLLALFVFGFAIPAGLGALVYAGLKLLNKESSISPTLLIGGAVLLWRLGWWAALHK